MPSSQKYVVVHPVRHSGKLHDRGTVIELGGDDAVQLLDLGVIKSADVIVIEKVVAGPSTAETLASYKKLLAMTVSSLIDYGKETYGLQLNPEDSKESIVAAIHDMYVASLSQAE